MHKLALRESLMRHDFGKTLAGFLLSVGVVAASPPRTVEDVANLFEQIRADMHSVKKGFDAEIFWEAERFLHLSGGPGETGPRIMQNPEAFERRGHRIVESRVPIKGSGKIRVREVGDTVRVDFLEGTGTVEFRRGYPEPLFDGGSCFLRADIRLMIGRGGVSAGAQTDSKILAQPWGIPVLGPSLAEVFDRLLAHPWPVTRLPRSKHRVVEPVITQVADGRVLITVDLNRVDSDGTEQFFRQKVVTLHPDYDYRPSRVEWRSENFLDSEYSIHWVRMGDAQVWLPTFIDSFTYMRRDDGNGSNVNQRWTQRVQEDSVKLGETAVSKADVEVTLEMLQHAGVPTDGTSPAARSDPHNQTFVEKVQDNIWRIVFVLSLATGVALLLIRHRMNRPA
jgi:hypothetical protein